MASKVPKLAIPRWLDRDKLPKEIKVVSAL